MLSDVSDGTAVPLLTARGKPAIFWMDEVISYEDLLARVHAVAGLYASMPGDRIAIFAQNRPEWIAAAYSVWRNRCVLVPVDAMCPAEEVRYILQKTRPTAVFCSAKTEAVLRDAVAQLPPDAPRPALISMDAPDFPEQVPASGTPAPILVQDADALAAILFTSGTTGMPKGVMLTFGNMLANLTLVCERVPIFNEKTRMFALLPLHHILPLMGCMMASFYAGSSLILAHSLDPTEMVKSMQRHRATILIGVPRLYALLRKAIVENLQRSFVGRLLFRTAKRIHHPAASRILLFPVQKKFGGCLRQMVSGGAALEREVAMDLTTCGFEVLEGFGMTECAPMISFPRPGTVRLGSCGNPALPDCVRIEDGEVLTRGPHVFKGYWEDPAATEEAVVDGWLHTGDLGYLDNDNYLFITGRKKEIIALPNGKKVNPAELEEKLVALDPNIREVAVTMRDGLLHAILVPVPGLEENVPARQAEYFRWKLLDPYNRLVPPAKKITQLTIFEGELPKTRLGKLKRHELAPLAVGTFAAAGNVPKVAFTDDEQAAYDVFARFLQAQLDCKRVSPDSHWDMDLALDSLARLTLLVFIEKTFGVKWPEGIFMEAPTVADLVRRTAADKKCFNEAAGEWDQLVQVTGTAAAEEELELPRSNWLHPVIQKTAALLLRVCFRVSQEGAETLPMDRPVILAANHQSYIDGLFVSMFLKTKFLRNMFYYAKAKHVKPGALSWLAAHCNVIVVQEGHDVQASIQKLAKALKLGKSVLIFPEGTRSVEGQLGDFRGTFAHLAAELAVPVVPVAIRGAWKALPRGHHTLRFGTRVEVRFLEPIQGNDPAQIVEATQAAIAKNV